MAFRIDKLTILPAGGFNRGGEILYVDGADGYGSQPYFDGAFMVLGLTNKIDRYDVRSPASGRRFAKPTTRPKSRAPPWPRRSSG